ncbi:fibronectin type III domain-containing protein [Candidatus Uhrbacteria bacterium]|nr:fibronectin type III domain-containing protein [Candidatus Uhrbacteria bacterium]
MCTTCNSVPGIPRNLAAAPADENIRITWQPPLSAGSSPIDQYTVYRKVGNAGEQVFYRNVDNAAALLLDDANLENGTVYCYAVSAVNGHGEGEVTDQRCATPTASGVVPGMPRNVVADGLDRRIVLTWEAPASAGTTAIGKYTVYRREGNDGALIYLKDVTTLTNLRLEDSGLANGRVYCYAVSAHNQQGEGVAASEECATPTAVGEVPGVPRTLTVQGLVEHATIRWQAPASSGTGAILGFRIYRRNGNGGSFAFLRQVSETVIDDEGLAPGSVMCYQVAAYNAMGEGEATIEECATVIGMAPFKPDDLSATDDGQAVEVRWLPNTEGAPFDEYRLYRSRQPIPDELATLPTTSCGAQGSAAGDQLCLVGVFDRSQTRYGDDAVRSNLLYHYRILAYNEWGLSPLSDPASGKICPDCEHDGTEPYRPNLSAWADDGTIALEWSPHPSGPGVLGFRLYRDDSVIADEPELPLPTNPCPTTPGSGSGAFCLVATFVNPMERDYRDRTVQQDVPYHYRILAYNAVGDSELSNNASATMEIGPGPKLLDHVNIIVDPGPDTPATSDSFACGGTRCADDRGSDPGVQHRWSAQACSADGDCRLDASFEWAVGQGSSGVAGVQLSNHQRQSTNQGDDLFATPVDNGSFDVTVIARQINGRSARKTMRVTVALPLVRSVEIFDSQNRPFPTGGRDEYARDGQAQHQYRIRVYDIATPTSDEQRDAHEIEAALDWWIGSFTNLAFEVNGDRADSQIRVNSLPEIAIAHNYPEGYLGISAWGLPGFSSAGSSVNNWITLAYAGIDQGPRLPDLTIESLSALTCDGASANLPVCSGMIRRTHYGQVVIKNQGSIAAMRDFPVSIYWNNKLLWLDTWPRQEPKRMDPGATLTLQFILPSDINVNQPNALRVVLDSLDQDTEVFPDSSSEYVVTQIRGNPSYRDNMIQESDEENNGRQVIVGRNLPDLAFTASPFERFEEGGIWKLKFRAINLGPGVVTQNFAALLYENGIFKESTFATPIPGGSGVIPPLDSPLDPDAVVDVVFQDPTQSLATYRSVRLDLDGLRSVEETDETNNSLTIGLGGEVKRLDLIAPQSLGMLRQLRLQRATTADEELPLTNIYSDSFLCAGRDTCPDDMDGPANTVCPDPAAADYWQAMSRLINYSASDPFAQWENCYYGLKGRTGVQHRYLLQAYADQEGTQPLWLDVRAEVIPSNPRLDTLLTLSDLSGTPANMLNKQLGFYQRLEPKPSTSAQWTVLPNSIHASNRLSGVYVTANGDAGTSTIRFTAEGDGVYAQGGTSATRSLNVEVFPCEHPWPSQVGAFPFDDTRDYANRFLFNQYDATMHLRSGNFSRIPGEQSINGQYQSFSIGYCRDGVPLEEVRSDAFSCVGDRCSDDDDPATAGNQHLFKVEGYDQNGTQIKTGLTYTWASSDGNNNIVRIHSGQDEPGLGSEQLAISSVGNGTANITVTVGQGTLSRTMVMPVSVTWLRQGSGLNVPVAPISQSIEPRYRIADNEGASGILSSIKVYAMPKLLPDLRLQSVELPRLRTPASQRLKQFYFREPGAPDLIALTVMQNGQQFSAARWYLESNAVVNPRADRASVSSIDCQNRRTYAPTLPEGEDCVDGIQEGDTWYYTMARLRDDDVLDNTVVGSDGMTARSRYKQLFTNVYLLSITKDARKEMQSVVPQLLNRWKFALNIDDPGVRTALKRDVRRASDLRDLEVRLKNYATQNSKFPELTAGTFIRGLSYSTWPSWQETLKENLDGGPRIASDPLNYFVGCNRPHDPQTCWDEAAKNFQCPSAGNARAYVYSAKGPNNVPSIADGYLGTFFEVWPSSRPGFSRDREIGDPFSALTPGPFVNGVASNVAKSIGANGCNANLLRLNKP